MKSAWVYILRCSDASYYVGCTTNLHQRLGQHNAGTFEGYTSTRRPVELVWSQEFSDIRFAIEAERKLKKWTRPKKEALMRSDFNLLHELSRSTKTKMKRNKERNTRHHANSHTQQD
ncbi:MAG: GIY-YIG nuclease family protein [Bacteroidota bacterium]